MKAEEHEPEREKEKEQVAEKSQKHLHSPPSSAITISGKYNTYYLDCWVMVHGVVTTTSWHILAGIAT
jgi:hypothetical protein